MASTELPGTRYHDAEYQKHHTKMFDQSLTQPLKPVLPPGLSQEQFEAAVKDFVGVVGKKGVFMGNALKDYVDPFELWEHEGKRKQPSAAVCPENVDQLQAILKVANKHSVPVWTFSRGKNLGYGGPAPRVTGCVALDLHRMDKIIEVNEEYAYAVVEPGVTFTDLYNYCVQNKLKVWPSTPSLGWGSVVGNTVDRGIGFTPTATHHQNIAGLEVMLADGDLVRTGQFGISNSKSAHLSKFTFGPSIEGLFLQSNLAIVTKLGIWLHPQPQAYMSVTFDVPDFDDIEAMTDTFGELRRNQLLPNAVYVSNVVEWISMMGRRDEVWKGEGPIPDWRIKELQQQLGVGYWALKTGLYGHKDVIQAHFEELKKICAEKCPKGRIQGNLFEGKNGQLLEATEVPEEHGGFFCGVPSLWSLPMVQYRVPGGVGKGAHCDYSGIIPSDGKLVLEWAKLSKKICESHGWDLFCDFYMHERHVILINMMCYDKSLPDHRKAVDAIFHELFQEGKKRGYSKYRSHINHMDLVSDQYDFNDHAYRRFVESIKDTLDPNGILSPGKMGIWPKKYRHLREVPARANL
ncbi:hypothetical protein CAC42_902 [Sphaceloma murrayae]|uniref:FAD-binding PCMH-type domain-containing protein n=1 Tax=Sphaceloma murrayae TaxID=2082308 RepID=A0A2K1R2Z6_9PEZI|nr:hypothetical protein CAC42_902 [Sphaceloma murrayae]